jgi:glycosyltransferase involved in cell wall biosynthesis
MSLRIAIIVPVAYTPREDWNVYAHRYIPLLHAEHLANEGHEVHLYFDGPDRAADRTAHGRFTLHVVSSIFPAFHGVVRSPHLVRAAAAVKPDVVHVHNLLAAENIAAAVLLDRPVFAEFHGGAPSRFGARRSLLRWASSRLAGVFAPALEHLTPLLEAGALTPSITCHVSPETSSRFHVAAPRVLERGLRFFTVARCEPPKDPRATVAVFRALSRVPEAAFIWACPGGQELESVRNEIEPSLSARLDFGPRSLAEMPQLYANADVTVITSEREIGATVVSESLSQGTPVAAFDLPAIRALGAGCEAVRLVTGRNVEALASVALELARANGIREKARSHYEQKLSFSAIARDRARIYQRAVER